MTNWHYYDANGIKQGPIDDAKLKMLAQHGIVKPTTLTENDLGQAGPAGKIRGLEFPMQTPVPVQTQTTARRSREYKVETKSEYALRNGCFMAWNAKLTLVYLLCFFWILGNVVFIDADAATVNN